jgi:hypothetical protein
VPFDSPSRLQLAEITKLSHIFSYNGSISRSESGIGSGFIDKTLLVLYTSVNSGEAKKAKFLFLSHSSEHKRMMMKSFLFTFQLLVCITKSILVEGGSLRGVEQQHNRTLVIGGKIARPGDYPYFVHFATPGCGGTLIAPDIVLTAGHVSISEGPCENIVKRRQKKSSNILLLAVV